MNLCTKQTTTLTTLSRVAAARKQAADNERQLARSARSASTRQPAANTVKQVFGQTPLTSVCKRVAQVRCDAAKRERVHARTFVSHTTHTSSVGNTGQVTPTEDRTRPLQDDVMENIHTLPAWRDGNNPVKEEHYVFSVRCEHCILLHECMSCSKSVNLLQLRRNRRLYVQYWRERIEARCQKVHKLNDDLDAELRQELQLKYRPNSSTEDDQVPQSVPRPRKISFNLTDVPQPVKERELRYEDFADTNEGLLLQWGNRLHHFNYDREAWVKERDAMVAKRGCATTH